MRPRYVFAKAPGMNFKPIYTPPNVQLGVARGFTTGKIAATPHSPPTNHKLPLPAPIPFHINLKSKISMFHKYPFQGIINIGRGGGPKSAKNAYFGAIFRPLFSMAMSNNFAF